MSQLLLRDCLSSLVEGRQLLIRGAGRRGMIVIDAAALPLGARWLGSLLSVLADGVCDAAFFASRATFSSSSAIRAAAALAVRLASRFFTRNVALARSSFSTCTRSSSLLSFRAGAAATGARLEAVASLVTFSTAKEELFVLAGYLY